MIGEIMTYIEFFDKTASENISTCLMRIPERVIYIGQNKRTMEKHIQRYQKVFADRGYDIEMIPIPMPKSNLYAAVSALSQIVETYDDCVFDLTGGEEVLNLALGIVWSTYRDKNIQVHKINIRNNKIYDYDADGNTIFEAAPTLSIEENIRIYGGDVVYGEVDEDNTYKWDMNPDFLQDIELIWSKCRQDVRYWNTHINILDAINKKGKVSEDGLTVTASIKAVKEHLSRHRVKYKPSEEHNDYLLKHGLLTGFDDSDGNTVTVSFKNPQVKRCLTKAGQALEMKMFALFCDIRESDGTDVYDDLLNGVVIDWDGTQHDEKTEHVYDTENEVDIVAMHDIVPVFVSCKNGEFSAEELYKLQTVAERFGGQYAKKVLIATSVDAMGTTGEYLRQRAKDMNIRLMENVQNKSDEQIKKELEALWKY